MLHATYISHSSIRLDFYLQTAELNLMDNNSAKKKSADSTPIFEYPLF